MAAPTSLIRPFLPAKDYEVSRAFYRALGFRVDFEGDQVTAFSNEAGSFLLQNYWADELAGHLMMAWSVGDLDGWFEQVRAMDLPGRFGVPAPRAPEAQPWGMVISYLVDPAGVLWHVSQKPAGD